MVTDAALRLIVSEPHTLFTTGVLPFSVCFFFFIYGICFPFFSALLFCWRLLLQQHVKWICSSMDRNSWLKKRGYWPCLEHGSEQEMKVADDKCCVRFRCVKCSPHGCTLAKYEHASWACERVNQICPTSFQLTTGMLVCSKLHPCCYTLKRSSIVSFV